jgi:hypothetical protein
MPVSTPSTAMVTPVPMTLHQAPAGTLSKETVHGTVVQEEYEKL